MRVKNMIANERHQQIYNYIKSFFLSNGFSPSVREIRDATGLASTSTVHAYLKQMEESGLISRSHDRRRAIVLPDEISLEQKVRVPLVGTVAAGMPILAQENIEDTFFLPASLLPSAENIFMLRLKGDSMINIGMLDGDLILVQEQSSANDGDIVVALIDNAVATVKRYFREKDCIRLQPENDALEPFYEKNVKILGKVVGLYRNMV